ncbi:MAG: hypothetical protein ACXVKM_11110, partial [Flavisolibacter sp.]
HNCCLNGEQVLLYSMRWGLQKRFNLKLEIFLWNSSIHSNKWVPVMVHFEEDFIIGDKDRSSQ